MLVHSHLYYALDQPIVEDHVWQDWANELAELQRAHPGVHIGFYDPEFADWDGSTGMHLPSDGWVVGMATHLLALHVRLGGPPLAPVLAAILPPPAARSFAQASLF